MHLSTIKEQLEFTAQLQEDHREVLPKMKSKKNLRLLKKEFVGGTRITRNDETEDYSYSSLINLLNSVVGISRIRLISFTNAPNLEKPLPSTEVNSFTFRRPIPSGGGIYPTEFYCIDRFCGRLFYFDPFQASLTYVKPIDEKDILPCVDDRFHETLLNGRFLVFIVTNYWKTFFKYNNVAFRLASIDTGFCEGRLAREAAQTTKQVFVTRSIDRTRLSAVLNLFDIAERVSSLFVLNFSSSKTQSNNKKLKQTHVDNAQFSDLSEEMIDLLNSETGISYRTISGKVILPMVGHSYTVSTLDKSAKTCSDFVESRNSLRLQHQILNKRSSSARRFNGNSSTKHQLNTILSAISKTAEDSLSLQNNAIRIFCTIFHVDDINPGLYEYANGSLVKIKESNSSSQLAIEESSFQLLHNFDIGKSSFVTHIAGMTDWSSFRVGVRGYTEQQMDIGRCAESGETQATLSGLSSHTFMGFLASEADKYYRIYKSGFSCMIQTCYGNAESDSELEISTDYE